MAVADDLVSWSMSAAMSGAYSAQVKLTNPINAYTLSLVGTIFQIELQVTGNTLGVSPTLFAGTTTWVSGVVHSVNEAEDVSAGFADLQIRSYVALLSKKPISSHLMIDTPQNVIISLANIYGTIPSGLRSFSCPNPRSIFGFVNGNNLLDEMKLVAQAGSSSLFVQADGILTTGGWKDNTSSIDVVLPPEALISATHSLDNSAIPTRINIRGRFLSIYDCGTQILSSSDGDDPFQAQPYNPNDGQDKGSEFICTESGVGQPTQVTKPRVLTGNKDDLRNATYNETTGNGSITATSTNESGQVEIEVTGGADYMPAGAAQFKVETVGQAKPANDKNAAAAKRKPLRKLTDKPEDLTKKIVDRLKEHHDFYPSHGGGDSDKTADEPELIRMEMIVSDPGLVAEYGVIYEQIDNIYISDFDTMFDVAVRRFQELRMGRCGWNLEVVYMPGLRLNQVIQFTSPKHSQVVTGLISEIKVESSSDKAKMQLSVQSFEELGSTTYVSANLFIYPEMCGYNGVNWVAGWTGFGFVRMMGGYVAIGTKGGAGTAFIYQNLLLEGGVTYTFSYIMLGSITGTVYDPGLSPVLVGPGSFVPAATGVYRFRFDGTGANSFLTRPYLFKTVVR